MNALTLTPLAQPVVTEVAIPGSKSYTIRALLIAALTPGVVRIVNPLISDDTVAMLGCLKALGIESRQWPENMQAGCPAPSGNAQNPDAENWIEESWIDICGDIRDVQAREYTLDADLSAASLRFLLALSAIMPGVQILHGKEGLNKRPVRDLVDALRALGAEIDYLERDGYPPVRVSSSTLHGQVASISGAMSSQYISALLMIAPAMGKHDAKNDTRTGDALRLTITGELISKPYLDMTASIMRAFGVSVVNDHYQTVRVSAGQTYGASPVVSEPHEPHAENPYTYKVEGDASSASYYMAVAALTHSRITLRNLPAQSAQADMRFLEILEQMGTEVTRHADHIVVQGHGVKPLTVNMQDCPDQAQTLAVLAAFADGVTRIDGLRSLRVKETDRLAAVACELSKMGLTVIEEAEALVIHGGSPKPASIATYGDHRMAMAFAVAGAAMDGLCIENPAVVSKTYPTFWEDWQRVGIGIQPVAKQAERPSTESSTPEKIVLIGFMGAGKSVLSSLLAQQLGWEAVEMDALIVARSGRHSVRDIFERDGETRFRELEIETARVLRESCQTVISTGGGLVMNKIAIDYLSEGGAIVFLDAQLETVFSRLGLSRMGADNTRPLLQDRTQTEALYDLRTPLYRHYAKLHVVTDGKTPEAIASEIAQALEITPPSSQNGTCAAH